MRENSRLSGKYAHLPDLPSTLEVAIDAYNIVILICECELFGYFPMTHLRSQNQEQIIEKHVHHRAVKTEAVVYSVTDLDSLIICNHSSTTKTFFGNLTRNS